jgi:class 3 adenylate cyclase
VATPPRTRYAKCGDIDIAYQVLGDGPHDLLMFAGTSVPIDCIEADPAMARFHRRLASFCRIIRFDQRGIGLSSHLTSPGELGPKYWAEDALAVLDAVGCERVTVFAPSFAAMTGLVLAAEHPERVRSLIVVNGAARALWAPDYPAGVEASLVEPFLNIAVEPDAVEQGFDGLAIIAPSVARDDTFRAWWDRSGNRGATPSMARAVAAVIAQVDVRDSLPKITMPTLIVHRVDNLFIAVGHGRYLAEHLPQARYLELPGADTLYWVGDASPMLDEIEEFLTGSRGATDVDRVLATVLFTDIVGSTDRAAQLGDNRWRDLLDNHDRIVRHELERFGGREVNSAGDGFVATFVSPSRAIDCAEAVVEAVRPLGIEVRVGIHAGEIELRGDDVAGMAVHIGARVAGHAGASEILVSSTLRDIVTGSSRRFASRGEHPLKGVPGTWRLFAVERAAEPAGA